ncbi:hypothetical protein [Winogradskyella ludwigii]|jgi:hypothetical protein|uniref:hypothetical protein n=1 Tax=Winogradskyella ludwigii TaxID=2686076 RepID=UPI0015C9DD1E|nr:hypothetical protein [Winogradskyella ludwigii]
MKESLTFDFCSMTIYDNYVITVINEGVVITLEHNETLLKVAESYFSNKPFVYISNRINSYSVDPKVYFKTEQIPTIKGLAVVTNNYQVKVNAKIEKMFFNKPFEIFTELEDAVAWANEMTYHCN